MTALYTELVKKKHEENHANCRSRPKQAIASLRSVGNGILPTEINFGAGGFVSHLFRRITTSKEGLCCWIVGMTPDRTSRFTCLVTSRLDPGTFFPGGPQDQSFQHSNKT